MSFFEDLHPDDIEIQQSQRLVAQGTADDESYDLEETYCTSRSPTEIIDESEESGEPECENFPNESEAELSGKELERMSSVERAIANEKLELDSKMELFVEEKERLEAGGPATADALQEINLRITKLQESIDELIMDDSENEPILIVDKPICDDELYSYYTTENFCVYDLIYFHTLEGETKQFNAKTKINDIRPRLKENFCSNFPHLKDKELLPIHQNFLDIATDEQLREKYNELLPSSNALPKINTIKRKLKEEMNKLELRNILKNIWNITHFNYPDIFGFYAKKVFFTRMQTKLGMVDEEQHYLLRLDYNSSNKTFSFDQRRIYELSSTAVQLTHEFVLKKLFKFTRDKRVVVELGIPGHACLLISEHFCNLVTNIYEKKIIFYNPSSSDLLKYRYLKTFIGNEYKKICGTESIDYIWVASNKIRKQYDFSIQEGPTCSLFTQKLCLLTILNPDTPVEILIDYSFNQTSDDEKQYILIYYSILYFIELFMKYYPTISSKIQTLVLWDQNKQGDPIQISVSEIINKILESYLVTSNYLVNNECPRFTLSDELYDTISSQVILHNIRDIILKYKTDKDFIIHPEDFEPLRLVPDFFIPKGDIPSSASFGRKRTIKSKKRKKYRKSKFRKSKRKKSNKSRKFKRNKSKRKKKLINK